MKTPVPSLKINEIFYSLQGEGAYTGIAAVFVRLSGCSMNCPFCDTRYANQIKQTLTPQEILKAVSEYPAKTIIITGGEPGEQDIQQLCRLLKENGYQIHIESNGSCEFDTEFVDHLTVSPKQYVSEKMLLKANVIKILVGQKTDMEDLKKYFQYATPVRQIYLQPLDNTEENINLCVQIIKQNPFLRLSLQTHKMISIK